jgi:ABC-type arginine transport system permease subunit
VAQHDAARALGLRPALIMALVVVPQVFRIVLPPLGNQIVSAVLGSAQASIIGVAELTYQTQSIGSSTFRYFELFTIAALFYIACAQLISLVWRLLTGRAAHAPARPAAPPQGAGDHLGIEPRLAGAGQPRRRLGKPKGPEQLLPNIFLAC